jgi:hypothetical protein
MLPEIKKRKTLSDLYTEQVGGLGLPEIPQASLQMAQPMPPQEPTMPAIERKPVSAMDNYELTQNASRDAKAAGVAQMTPEKRLHWARLDNEFAAEKIRRKEEKEAGKKKAATTNQIGNMVRTGAITPEDAVRVAKLHEIDTSPDYMANYLPKIKDTRRPALPTIDEYKQQKYVEQQLAMQSEMQQADLSVKQSLANKNNADAAKNLMPPIVSDLEKAQAEQIRANMNKKPSDLEKAQTDKILSEIGQNKQDEMTPYEKLAQKKLDEIERIESIPEADRTIKDKQVLGKLKTGLTADAELKAASDLRKEFNASQVLKAYQIVSQSAKAIESAYNMSTNPDTKSRIASDQALGVAFQKMLDPQSVVRESEYERTPEGVSLMNRLAAWIPKLAEGGMGITDSDRKALYDMAKQFLAGHKNTVEQHVSRYNKLAQEYGINPELVTGGIIDGSGDNVSNNDPLGLGL